MRNAINPSLYKYIITQPRRGPPQFRRPSVRRFMLSTDSLGPHLALRRFAVTVIA